MEPAGGRLGQPPLPRNVRESAGFFLFSDPFFFLEGEAAADPFTGARIAAGGVELVPAEDGADVGLGGGEVDSLKKLVGLHTGGVGGPTAGAGDTGIVFGQAEHLGAIGSFLRPTADGAGELPRADLEVGAGIEKVGLAERADSVNPGPILGGTASNLH